MTIENSEQELFDSKKYISSKIQSSLPLSYLIRPLKRNDYQHGYIQLLSQLSKVGNITAEQYKKRFDFLKQKQSSFIVVVENQNVIVACATLLIEYKFLHECSNVGHIEDVVVDKSERGNRLGKRLIDQLHYIAQQTNCYKTILNCSREKILFYEKCQLKETDVQMTRYF
ncbi:acyl-CoA N-acyltransferase [Cokeromyces recurvatus]|uniref:acyl-CoA N-acyltransferase n=1 Tax=Cokeromyces recurvatus TaxID=90255 RepID=UPI00221E4769|nr:acyl-CoA N-acyltransferase [Cokeromyces recurvatus]KAI7904968.1 acyl-CoA N-acyltransferase [Cokeromyces recurvatus]